MIHHRRVVTIAAVASCLVGPTAFGVPAPAAAHLFAFGVLAGCCVAMTALLVTCEWALRVTGASARDLQLDASFAHLAGPLSSLVW